DSRSATNTRLRRPPAGCTSTSMAASPIACRAVLSALAASASSRTRSQACPGASQSGLPADKALPIAAARPGSTLLAPGPPINVTTKLMPGDCFVAALLAMTAYLFVEQSKAKQSRAAREPTSFTRRRRRGADRERQIGPRARVGDSAGRHDHQRRQPADLSRSRDIKRTA